MAKENQNNELKRVLGLGDLMGIGVGQIIGSGIMALTGITIALTGAGTPLAFIEKRRSGNDANASALSIIGDVYGRDCILCDDEVDTAGSMSNDINLLIESGATSVHTYFVHPVFSGSAVSAVSSEASSGVSSAASSTASSGVSSL